MPSFLFVRPGHEVRPVPVDGALDLHLLYRARGIDVLGTDLRAGADEGALPGALGRGELLLARFAAAVARVQVPAVPERDRRRTEVLGDQAIFGARGIAQHAVDAQRELLVALELRWRLAVFGSLRRRLLGDQVRLDARQLGDEVVDHRDEVALDGEMPQRLDADRAPVVAQERLARELRLAVDHHAAAAAHGHVARPAVAERRIDALLDL